MAHVRKPVKRGRNPLSPEAFTLRAIEWLKGKYPGMHTVYSGFNQAFRAAYPMLDPVAFTQALARKGRIRLRLVKGGAMLFLPGAPQHRPSVSFEALRALHDGQRRNAATESDAASARNIAGEEAFQAFLARLFPIFALAQRLRVTPEEIVRRSNAAGIDLLTPFAEVPRETLLRISKLFKRRRRSAPTGSAVGRRSRPKSNPRSRRRVPKTRTRPAPRRSTRRRPRRTATHSGRLPHRGTRADARTVAVDARGEALATPSSNSAPDNCSLSIPPESPATSLQQPGGSSVLHADTGRAPEAEVIPENRSATAETAQLTQPLEEKEHDPQLTRRLEEKERELAQLTKRLEEKERGNIRLNGLVDTYEQVSKQSETDHKAEVNAMVADLAAKDLELSACREGRQKLERVAMERRADAMTYIRCLLPRIQFERDSLKTIQLLPRISETFLQNLEAIHDGRHPDGMKKINGMKRSKCYECHFSDGQSDQGRLYYRLDESSHGRHVCLVTVGADDKQKNANIEWIRKNW